MGIRFAKSIKLGDLLKVNISKSGVSATIGKKGASINLGSKGTYLNLSPTIAGITGTGVSYRKKITGGYGTLLNKITGNTNKKEITKTSKQEKENKIDLTAVEEYEKNLNESINVHKLADQVLNVEQFDEKINNANDSLKEVYTLSKNGDEDTIEQLVGSFMANFDFAYPVNANYELEDHLLYVDLDLPEIENLLKDYPTIVKDKIVSKKKSQAQLKQEYAYTVLSLSAYLSAEFFNLSSYIEEIIISGFTLRRNSDGELNDDYIYSIKYKRNAYEETDLSKVENIIEFINKFDNRLNLNESTYTFKAIKPYEMPSVEKANNMIDEAISGLKELGYKNAKINEILPKLNNMKCDSSSSYLKEALKLISDSK